MEVACVPVCSIGGSDFAKSRYDRWGALNSWVLRFELGAGAELDDVQGSLREFLVISLVPATLVTEEARGFPEGGSRGIRMALGRGAKDAAGWLHNLVSVLRRSCSGRFGGWGEESPQRVG